MDDIWQFIAADDIAAADRLLDRIGDIFRLLTDNPKAGRLRSELAPHIRSWAVGNYVVFYAVQSDGVDVVRVLHGARDITTDDLN